MTTLYNKQSAKKATNLSINGDLLQKAKSYGLNLSQHFEHYLERLLKEKEKQKWLEESKEAIEKQNSRIEHHGTFSDNYRRF
jgi:antitoxin CcdA